jgi:RHS repeat-associated protein
VTSQSLNAGTALSFGYDADGLLSLAGALTVVPDAQNGRLSASTLGAVTDAYTYDTFGQIASYTASYSGSAVYAETVVSRDLNGRITEKTDALEATTHDWKYTYDPAGRLTDVTEDGTHVSHYGYDGDDNRISVGVTTVTQPTYDTQDRLSTYPSLNATYAFTANGELTTKTVGSQVTSYNYDSLGNLLHVGLPAALPDGTLTVDYVVDGQNRRVGRKVNGALVSGWLYQDQLRPVAQLDGSGTNVVARFVYGSKTNVPDYMVTSGGTYRILSDHLGSPRLVVDSTSGAVIETINFDEFGNETDTLAATLPTGYARIPFGFAGGLYEPDTGLVRFGARDYDASVGRWTNKDPTLFDGGSMNVYGYVLNDPIDEFDEDGTSIRGCAQALAKLLPLIWKVNEKMAENALCPDPGHTKAIAGYKNALASALATAQRVCTAQDIAALAAIGAGGILAGAAAALLFAPEAAAGAAACACTL